jgi:hypothetical protein
MATSKPRKKPDDDGSFEPFADFKVSFRNLALRLVELHGQPQGQAWPSTDPAPTSKKERGTLATLAFEHFLRHDRSTTPAEPRCVIPDDKCKALGAAKVVFALGGAPAHERHGGPAGRLRPPAAKLHAALGEFSDELAIYLRDRQAIHDAGPVCTRRAHALFCVYPAQLAAHVQHLHAIVGLFDHVSLAPQIPDHLRTTARRGLLVSLEMTLLHHGWSVDDILAVLHDAVIPADGKPTFRKRKGRLKLRLDHHAGKPTVTGV